MWDTYEDFPRYITVAERAAQAKTWQKKLRKKGYDVQPIDAFRSNKIAQSFWGHGWCRHLEKFSDYRNRLGRGRSYVRHGSVCHLAISPGRIDAFVSGSELYTIAIRIDPLPEEKWTALKRRCSGKIGSLIELLQGKLSNEVMALVTDRDDGLFPSPEEIHLDCNCPDYADLCKHLAAVLYGVGVRLDDQPELLFTLRQVDHEELIETDFEAALDGSNQGGKSRRLATDDLSHVFGVDIDASSVPDADAPPTQPKRSPAPAPKSASKKKAPKPRAKSPARKRPKKRSAPRKTGPPTTGSAVRKLRRAFDMSEYEFGLMIDVSAVTVRNWESKGRSRHNARPTNQENLNTLAVLTKAQAQRRLDEYR